MSNLKFLKIAEIFLEIDKRTGFHSPCNHPGEMLKGEDVI